MDPYVLANFFGAQGPRPTARSKLIGDRRGGGGRVPNRMLIITMCLHDFIKYIKKAVVFLSYSEFPQGDSVKKTFVFVAFFTISWCRTIGICLWFGTRPPPPLLSPINLERAGGLGPWAPKKCAKT